MINNDWVNQHTVIQVLLDAEAQIANTMSSLPAPAAESLTKTRSMLHKQIEMIRDPNPPVCYGQDDCSTSILSRCPWRLTCGD